ncbi:MAG: RNA polymerase sigma-I factor [Peptococcaceae bacterium]|jgi:RNA polymerase sigma factor|nr:RNA polymerase sigma-I factor [Peptococcaceae bacterium]MDH7525119.1 RNA polymerase sigma-I factor [Peptococcaceae bacterium]
MLDDQLRQAIDMVQQGQAQQREDLIRRYLPFVLKVASQVCRRFVHVGVDDEASVALMAFNEALDKYDRSQGGSFFAFAESVIKRRMIDYFRKRQREQREIPWSSFFEEEGDRPGCIQQLDKLTWEKTRNDIFEQEMSELRRSEIMEYKKRLESFGITLQDLVKASPKHQDARVAAFQVARKIYENDGLRRHLQRTKSLPLKELEPTVGVSRKTMERQRKYIIALTVILMDEYYFLQEYLRGLKG